MGIDMRHVVGGAGPHGRDDDHGDARRRADLRVGDPRDSGEFRPSTEATAFLATRSWVHATGPGHIVEALEAVAAAGVRVSYDVSQPPRTERFAALGPLLEVAFLSATGADDPADLAREAIRRGARSAVVGRGKDGCLMLSGGELHEQPALPARVVDTLGAGDGADRRRDRGPSRRRPAGGGARARSARGRRGVRANRRMETTRTAGGTRMSETSTTTRSAELYESRPTTSPAASAPAPARPARAGSRCRSSPRADRRDPDRRRRQRVHRLRDGAGAADPRPPAARGDRCRRRRAARERGSLLLARPRPRGPGGQGGVRAHARRRPRALRKLRDGVRPARAALRPGLHRPRADRAIRGPLPRLVGRDPLVGAPVAQTWGPPITRR